MASKTFFRNFGDFKGLDLYSSLLSEDSTFATEFKNCEVSRRKSVRKRAGYSLAGNYMATGSPHYIGVYTRRSLVGSVVDSEIVGIGGETTNKALYKLQTGTFQITVPPGGTFSLLPAPTGLWYARCDVAGITVGAPFPLDVTTLSLAQLMAAINGLGAGWGCVITPYAKVDGAQVARSHAAPVLVFAGHTLSIPAIFPAPPKIYIPTPGIYGDIIEIAGNNIRIKHGTGAFAVAANEILGPANYEALLLPITPPIPGGTLTFTYWEQVPMRVASLPVGFAGTRAPVFKNLNNVLFFPAEQWTYAGSGLGLIKYDGREVYYVGLPPCPLTTASLTPAAGAGLSIGRYKYLAEYIRTDAAGNEIHGNASDIEGEAVATTTAGVQQVSIALTDLGGVYAAFLGQRNAEISAAYGPGVSLPVTAATNTLRLGDWIYFRNSAGALQYRQIVALTDTTATISGANVSVTNLGGLQDISNVLIRLHRTKVGGTFYYYLLDRPGGLGGAITLVDTLADTALGELWEGPFLGTDRRDMPPPNALIEEHQGLLVGLDSPDNPERLTWSNYESPEYWSASTNFQDVTSTEEGRFTAIASDSGDNLILFKESLLKIISGDLFSGGFSLNSEPRGDVGCPSSRGWVKYRGVIFFLSHGGPRIIMGGELQPVDDRLAAEFYKRGWRDQLRHAVVSFDLNGHHLRIFNYDTVNPPINYGYDVLHNVWEHFALESTDSPVGGAVVYGEDYYINTVSYYDVTNMCYAGARLWRRNATDTKYDFIDIGNYPIGMEVTMQWDGAEDFSLNKEFLRAVFWSVDNPVFTPFTLTVNVYRNFATATPDTTYSITYATAADLDKEVPLALNRAKVVQFKLTNSTLFECPHISGYEVEIAQPYRKEHLSLKDA